MTQNEVDFLPLRVTGVTATGKRRFDAEGKRKLIEACLQPGASIAGLALKAGVNANQLHKWIQLRERADAAASTVSMEALPPAFVPVVRIDEVAPVRTSPEPVSVRRSSHRYEAAKTATPARLSAQLPNGVTLQLECAAHDGALVKAMIEALGAR
ncbi:transposase IS3/IS911 [Burkholderia pseudomallei]|uniref:IS66-like element accessory protein TnpA n=1 Tax=Burkholderia pseudomallei TaxID=28450 RepID=UPI0005EA25F0|nr:transposase [Burkholderia pseudomallei]CAK0064987.1 transposase IS3/IS911 [Burkholderia pseudomallei]CFL74782.1 transposase IS3/IS911 [Burkholderia pseudomallei]CPJ20993.1 transposase IS3/IS911 [Burkholderia pseudomallei]